MVFISDEKYVESALELSFKESKKFFAESFYAIKLEFDYQLFDFSSFFLVKQCSGQTKNKNIKWFVKESRPIFPVKFSNKNSNGVIDLGDILYKLFPANTYEFTIKSIASLVRYVFSDFTKGEHYSLKEKETMSKEEENFFDNINIKEILLRNNNRAILMEDGSNYLMSWN